MNDLATTTPIAIDSIDQMETVSKKLAASGLMGKGTTPEMVFGLMLLCQSEGIHPITAMKRYHIVEGRPSMRADAMQAEFLARGGGLIFHVRTDEMVSATFFRSKELLTEDSQKRAADRFELMWTLDATEEPDKRGKLMVSIAKLSREGEECIIRTFLDCQAKGITEGRDGTKTNWKTSPRQMLTARVITEGVRLINPGLIAGIYNEDETADIVRHEREAQAKMLAAPTMQDADSIQAIIAGYDEEIKTASDSRKRTLLGLKSDLKCKLNDMLFENGALPPDIKLGEIPKEEPKSIEAVILPPAAKVTPWQEVICHIGGPTAKGKTLAFLFDSKRSAKAMKSITDWFAGINQDELTPEDKAKMPALLAAAKEGHAAWEKSNGTEQAGTPQQPATEQGWRGFILQSKDETMNGKKMSELTPTQMKSIGDWLVKVDMKNASLYQKQVAAMYALATGGAVSPELPAHVKELDVKLRESKIEPEVFLREMKNTGLIAESYTSMAEITEPEAREMLGNWTAVVEACDVMDV